MTSFSRHPRAPLAILWVVSSLVAGPSAVADTFQLAQGGQIEGEWLNRNEQPATSYLVRTPSGIVVSLPLGTVRETVRQSEAACEYSRRSPLTVDTAAAQWELAEWCRQKGLTQERGRHLRRVVELEPNHQRARYALGFQFQNGEWITKGDAKRRDGYEFYRGKWRLPQEIEILEARGRTELAEKEWLAKLKRWRQDLNTDRAAAAYEALASIRDPIAVRPIGEYFARERLLKVKMIYADVLAEIHTPPAIQVLVQRSLFDPDEEVFHYCVEKIARLDLPRIGESYVPALKDAVNVRVNRAATALAKLNDKSAVTPLIDALITTHGQIIPGRPGASSDSTTAGFSSDGGTFMKKGDGPTAVILHVQNQPVLTALNQLTGVDFGYDQRAWRYWHAQDKIAKEASQPMVNVRRD